ncbi:uncharacterized protein [Manis javanica]|uniref:uncharacterized protein n=1 Tax=Manis javanica TaxID=9974 RepID=UPI003C6D1CB7
MFNTQKDGVAHKPQRDWPVGAVRTGAERDDSGGEGERVLPALLGLSRRYPPGARRKCVVAAALQVRRPGISAAESTGSFTWARAGCDRCADERSAPPARRPAPSGPWNDLRTRLSGSGSWRLAPVTAVAAQERTPPLRKGGRQAAADPGHELDAASVAGLKRGHEPAPGADRGCEPRRRLLLRGQCRRPALQRSSPAAEDQLFALRSPGCVHAIDSDIWLFSSGNCLLQTSTGTTQGHSFTVPALGWVTQLSVQQSRRKLDKQHPLIQIITVQ